LRKKRKSDQLSDEEVEIEKKSCDMCKKACKCKKINDKRKNKKKLSESEEELDENLCHFLDELDTLNVDLCEILDFID
jgi:hypothetical protein